MHFENKQTESNLGKRLLNNFLTNPTYIQTHPRLILHGDNAHGGRLTRGVGRLVHPHTADLGEFLHRFLVQRDGVTNVFASALKVVFHEAKLGQFGSSVPKKFNCQVAHPLGPGAATSQDAIAIGGPFGQQVGIPGQVLVVAIDPRGGNGQTLGKGQRTLASGANRSEEMGKNR